MFPVRTLHGGRGVSLVVVDAGLASELLHSVSAVCQGLHSYLYYLPTAKEVEAFVAKRIGLFELVFTA